MDLMKQRFARIQSEEMSKNGLVIIVALYGQLLSGLCLGYECIHLF